MSTPDLFRTERVRRRKAVNRAVEVAATAAALLAVAVLVIVVGSVAKRGAGAMNLDFLTKTPDLAAAPGQATGAANAIIGTFVIVGLAILMALPIGVLSGIYLNELAPKRVANVLTLALDVLNGVPAIVIGIFVFILLVSGHGQAAWKGSFALSILMLPLVARSTQEVLALVPSSYREASLALGAAKWRTTLSVVLPQTVGGIVTGGILATARIAGETAPLLFTTSLVGNAVSWDPREALSSLPLFIFIQAEQADPKLHEQAWAAAFLLILFVLFASLIARTFSLRARQRLMGKR